MDLVIPELWSCSLLSGFVCKVVKDMVHGQSRIKTLLFDIGKNEIQIYRIIIRKERIVKKIFYFL
jgi:hypothetical protein